MNDKILIPIVLLFFVFSNSYSQNKGQYLKAADKSFAQENYYAAMKYYSEALEFDSTQADVWYKLGESAEAFYAFSIAEESYQKVLDIDASKFPLTKMKLAEVQTSLGKYGDAISYYQAVLDDSTIVSGDVKLKATLGLAEAEWAYEVISNPDTNIVIENLGEDVNSPYSEVSPTKIGNELYYTSFRFDNPNDKHTPPRQYNKVMHTESGPAIPWDGFNSDKRHTAHSAFSKDGLTRVYFTYCDYVNEADIRCEIYYREKDSTDVWREPVKLPSSINVANFNSTNPEIAKVNGEECLFFSSNKPGGKGGMDLYFSKVNEKGKFSKPVSLSEINTDGDDITPYYQSSMNTLYFSNNSRQGLGGHDIFKSTLNEGEWSSPEHLGYPLNSSYDDIHYKPSAGGASAYFASNRLGSIFLEREKESCCHDIYSMQTQNVELLVSVFDKFSKKPLKGTTVTLTRLKSKTVVESLTNKTGNDFAFIPERRYAYILKAEKPEYTTDIDTIYLDRDPMVDMTSISHEMFIDLAEVSLTVLTFDDYSKEGLVGTTLQLFELVGGERRLVEEKNNPDGNDFDFTVQPGKTYIVRGSKSGYEHDLDTIRVPQIIDVPNLKSELYLAPLIFAKFLPISLYFDNDHPDPNTRETYTSKSYLETWDKYRARQGEFMDEYGSGMQGQMKMMATQRLGGFFEKEVNAGGENLKTFTDLLYEFLKQGNNLELVLRGYTSPRAESDYNDMLSKRRIVSVKNHFERHNGGILREFIKSGKLVILERPYGETKSKTDVSDKLDDVRNSIYGVPASLERRVEIIDVKQAEDFQRGTR